MSFFTYVGTAIAIAGTSIAGAYYITKKKYPDDVRNFETKVAWYGLKTYCVIEETVNKFNIIKLKQPQKQNYITLINKEGKEIFRHTEPEFKKIKKDLKKGLDYDFIIYEIINPSNAVGDEKVKSSNNNKNKYEKNILLFDDHETVLDETNVNVKINNKVHFLSV